jgi:23S rRNA (adenine-N6)-dimethyltransferase
VRRAGVDAGDLVVDLGAGHGVLTSALVDAGARVVAVELHPRRLDVLREQFADAPVTVVAADVAAFHLPRRPFRVVANPPWSLAESIRRRLLRAPGLVRADLVLPRWLVHRWADDSARIEVGASLRAESFVPPAPTGSAVAVLRAPSTGTVRRP